MTRITDKDLERWQVGKVLCAYPGLSLKPITNGLIRLAGTLSFSADAPGLEQIDDAFDLDIAVPAVSLARFR